MDDKQYYEQTVDELVARMDRAEHQVQLLTKHIALLEGVKRNEFQTVGKMFDAIHTIEGRKS